MQQWRTTALTLLPLGTMSMLVVLFVVFWQAIGAQTTGLNGMQERIGELEQSLQENPGLNVQMLEQQLKQLQRNQRELEDRLSRMARQQTDMLQLEQRLMQQTRRGDPQPNTNPMEPDPLINPATP